MMSDLSRCRAVTLYSPPIHSDHLRVTGGSKGTSSSSATIALVVQIQHGLLEIASADLQAPTIYNCMTDGWAIG